MRPLLFLTAALHAAGYVAVQAAVVNFPDSTCVLHKDEIEKEMQFAMDMATTAAADLKRDSYFIDFFSSSLRNKEGFVGVIRDIYLRIAEIASGDGTKYKMEVTCNFDTPRCQIGRASAFTSDVDRRLNLCERFFTSPAMKSTQQRLDECPNLGLKEARLTRAFVLLHELTHTKYGMLDTKK